jgi:hypothetical protein
MKCLNKFLYIISNNKTFSKEKLKLRNNIYYFNNCIDIIYNKNYKQTIDLIFDDKLFIYDYKKSYQEFDF